MMHVAYNVKNIINVSGKDVMDYFVTRNFIKFPVLLLQNLLHKAQWRVRAGVEIHFVVLRFGMKNVLIMRGIRNA
jgi:hypothetical protein